MADYDSCRAMVSILDNFCQYAGLQMNKHKSSIIFSPNTPKELKVEMASMLVYNMRLNVVNILGYMLIPTKISQKIIRC